mmetsp:Transcript_74943/g.150677  ORF Transcript_74943/g.150677 Transcript_74943/m.150677 type:complete len:411 (-) Transcript_74943:223-1455(-)
MRPSADITTLRRRLPSSRESSIVQENAHEFSGEKLRKFAVRTIAAIIMFGVLLVCVFYFEHVGVGCLVSISACELFRELVSVAHSEVNKEREIPWFRCTLWSWFFVAMFAAYTADSLQAPLDFAFIVSGLPLFGVPLGRFLGARHYYGLVGLWMYASSFVATVASFRPAVLAYQLRALSFTALALSLFVVPMKMMIHNTFVGLFWFLLPLLLVAVNDSFAYLAGFFFGRKFIKIPFLAISPNKTWEGFIGGGIATLVAGLYLPLLLKSQFLTCSYLSIRNASATTCTPLTLFSRDLGGITEIQIHGLALACFASLVAPFGGFCASSIKRAYALKDFSNIIPGHGGLMDRLDCQFLMALATFVHLKTFVLKPDPDSAIDNALQLIQEMDATDRDVLVSALMAMRVPISGGG